MLSAPERLAAELAEVTGDTCGHSCDHHIHTTDDGPHQLVCLRQPQVTETVDGVEVTRHAGATLLVDQHVGRMPDGTLVTFGGHCCVEVTP